MKVVVKNHEEKEEIKFPCLMVYEPTNLIVLMREDLSGTVIHKGHSAWCNGDYTKSFGKNAIFKPFKGTITLSND